VGGQEIRVVDHERLAGDGAVAGEAATVYRDRELDEGRLGFGERLRQTEPQTLHALVAGFHKIEAAGIRLRDAPRLRQDQVEQRLQVSLGAERDADDRKLADLAGALASLAPGARR